MRRDPVLLLKAPTLMDEESLADLIYNTAAIVAAYVGNNSMAAGDLPALIATVHGALRNAGEPAAPVGESTWAPTRAQIRKSITDDALISFEDGRPYRTLKRHLSTRGLSPAAYKAKWGLPDDYPMTAPSYSEMRSRMAKSIGLGRPRTVVATRAKATPKAKASDGATATPTRRDRPTKAAKAAP